MTTKAYTRKPVTGFTFKEFISHFQKFGNQFVGGHYNIDEYNHPTIIEILNYFTYAAQSNLDLNKGILLFGGIGTGKDTIFDVINAIFLNFHLPTIKMVHALEISDLLITGNMEEILRYKKYYRHILIRDVGTEPEEVLNYGNKIRPLEELLLVRYENYRTRGFISHLTTNLSFEELSERFGDRMQSRLQEMFNYLELPGPDRRQAFYYQ